MYNTDPNKTNFEYDLISGISAESVNLGGLAVLPNEQEKMALDIMAYKWQHLTTPEIYTNWFQGGIVQGLML